MNEILVRCQGTDTKKLEELSTFQGALKKLSKTNLSKLKAAILKLGFIAPIFIWKCKTNNYILDGHQRIKALTVLQDEGYSIPALPVIYISASGIKEAKEKLLHITSQYGEFDRDGLDEHYCDIAVKRYIDWCKANKKELHLKLNGKPVNAKIFGGKACSA